MIRRLCLSLLMLSITQCVAFAQVDCVSSDGTAIVVEEDGGRVVTSLVPDGIRVGEQFSIELAACAGIENLRSINARMPAHGHGMNYQPTLTRTQDGNFQAEGFLFHMPGIWELMIEAEKDGKRIKLRKEISVLP